MFFKHTFYVFKWTLVITFKKIVLKHSKWEVNIPHILVQTHMSRYENEHKGILKHTYKNICYTYALYSGIIFQKPKSFSRFESWWDFSSLVLVMKQAKFHVWPFFIQFHFAIQFHSFHIITNKVRLVKYNCFYNNLHYIYIYMF